MINYDDFRIRTQMAFGVEEIELLSNKCVAVVGLGGVGGHTCEVLARSGVGKLIVCDMDVLSITNINRQILALNSTIGMLKTDASEKRILDINPNCEVVKLPFFYNSDNRDKLFNKKIDYIVDAIDSVGAKLDLIETAVQNDIKIISSMGFGNKFNIEKIRITDISKTHTCPLAKVVRTELKKRNIYKLIVAFSEEKPITPLFQQYEHARKQPPSSVAWIPSAAGDMIGGYVVTELLKDLNEINQN